MKCTFEFLAILSIFAVVGWAQEYQDNLGEDPSVDEQDFTGRGELFSFHLNDCSRQFCPTFQHECCCEGALSGGEACCKVETNGEACSLYVCKGGSWECAEGC